jgi:hypothetical protein
VRFLLSRYDCKMDLEGFLGFKAKSRYDYWHRDTILARPELHLTDLLIKGGVNIKEKKREVICAYVKLENASGL